MQVLSGSIVTRQSPPSKRFVLRHSDVSAGHVLSQARGFGLAVGDHRFFNLTVDLVLSAIGGRDKAVKTAQLEEETDQAHAARSDFDTNEVEGHHQSVHTSESRATLKESGHIGTDIQGVMPCTPGLQGGSGNLKLLSNLTLGHALGSQRTILLEEVRTFESIPAWLAVIVALWRILDSGSHSDLLGQSLAL